MQKFVYRLFLYNHYISSENALPSGSQILVFVQYKMQWPTRKISLYFVAELLQTRQCASRGCSVGIMNMLQAGRPRNRGSITRLASRAAVGAAEPLLNTYEGKAAGVSS
jgi:hypothetical protein